MLIINVAVLFYIIAIAVGTDQHANVSKQVKFNQTGKQNSTGTKSFPNLFGKI